MDPGARKDAYAKALVDRRCAIRRHAGLIYYPPPRT
jgi:hypothetical protein